MTGKPETPRSGRASCPFCGQNFDLPGFDDEQIAGVIAAHIAANHGKEALAETETQKEASRPVPLDGPVRAEGGDARGASPQNADAATEQVPPNAGIEHGPPNAGSGTLPALPGTPQHRDEPPASGENPVRGKQRDSDSVTRSPETGPRNKPPIDDDLRRSKGAQNTKAANDEQPETNGNKKGTEKNGPKRKPQERGQEKDAAAGEHRKGTGAGPGGLKDRLLRGSPLAKKVADRVTGSSKKTSGTAGSKPAADRARPEGVKAGLEQKLTKSLQAAGASAGIPPIVTKIALKVAKRGVPILAAFTLVVIATLFGATFDADAPEDRVYDVALSDQLDIPDPYLDAYIDAARSQKIPWTLLAAIGANATYHGRIDPYKQTIPLPAARTIDDENAETIIVLTDGTLANAGTYLDALLAPQGYTVEIVPVPTGTIDRGAAWLDENGVDGARKLVVSLGGDETVDRQQFAEKVDRLVNTVGPYYPIIWVNLDGENAGPYNEVLREKDARRQNLRIVDWAGTSDVRGFAADATGNYDDEAQRTRAGLIAASVTGNAVSAGLPVSGELSGPGVLPTPTGDCPTLAVPVEGETPAQGAGPLMLLPAALVAAGYDLGEDVQNICDSADVLAEILAETARGVADEVGTTFPRGIANLAQQAGGGDSEAAEQVHDFWALVADRSGVLGTTEERECLVPEQGSLDEQSYVGNAIDSYWRCALANVELASVADVAVDAAGNVSYRTLSPADAVARGVDEALTVSWNASNWGTADCDETAVHAGVFPLDAVVFERYAPEPDAGRCNVEQNIIAAAEAFIAGESTPVATRRGRWNASIGGWSLVGPVAGPTGAGLFDALGPWEPLTVETSCSRAFVGEVLAAARDATLLPGMTAAQAQELAYAGSTDEFDSTGSRSGGAYRTEEELIAATSGLDRRLEAIVATLRTNPDCVQERPYADDEWLGVLAGAVNGDAVTSSGTEDADLDIPARTSGNLDVPASAGDRVLMIAGRAFSRAVSYGGVAAETGAYVQRLSPVRVALAARPGVSSEDGDRTLSLGSRLINVAVGYYGGIFVGNTGAALVGFGFLDDTVPYHEEFNAVGQEYGVDPRLLAAVAKQESNFDPEAGCPSEGAFGMMQKEFDTTPTLCGDVRRQIATAAEMLLDLQRRAGDWKGALWGYNNGALFADTWAELNGDVGAAETFAYSWYRGNGTCAATGECRRAEIAMDYISETPGDRSAMLNWLDYQRLFPSSVFSSRQTTVNGNQCPNVAPLSSIPGRTVLRDGAEDVGVRELCVEAVAAAPTPEAARAIIFAFNNLGVTYSQDLRSTASAFDCSSYVSRAYESAGVLMNSGGTHFATRHLFPHSGHSRPEWVVPIAVHAAKPGDLVFPSQGHVAMLLPRGFIIHTNATGDVSKVERGYANPLQTNRVVTEIAPRIGD